MAQEGYYEAITAGVGDGESQDFSFCWYDILMAQAQSS